MREGREKSQRGRKGEEREKGESLVRCKIRKAQEGKRKEWEEREKERMDGGENEGKERERSGGGIRRQGGMESVSNVGEKENYEKEERKAEARKKVIGN